jgi:nucleotidyltransferase AbiEii toxin of type IV toxin-antitoxin system
VPETAHTWHPEVIGRATERALAALVGASAITDFYLAGGTALALHLGHRLSEDLDFFSEVDFDERRLLVRLQVLPAFTMLSEAPATLHVLIAETKVSFLGYPYPLLFPLLQFKGTQVADWRDIACMKISAIASRGTRRDFIDLYSVARQLGLDHLLQLFQKRYAAVNYSQLHIFKSLVYFEEAEKDPLPNLLADIAWPAVRQYFQAEVPRLAARQL